MTQPADKQKTPELSIGASVEVTGSPYYSVPNGVVAEIAVIRLNHFGPGLHLYELAGLSHRAFREHEFRINITA